MEPKIRWPLSGVYPVTFAFGEAPDWYIKVFGYPHNGIDIGCPDGIPVLACDGGGVAFADDVPDSNGAGLILNHSWGLSLYWHLSKVTAKAGDQVSMGSELGFSGRSGFATGPHLHFGIKIFGLSNPEMRDWQDPQKYFETPAPLPQVPEPVGRKYMVRPGDTLWGIAVKFYGKGYLWRQIWDANRASIPNPNLIRPLQILTIP